MDTIKTSSGKIYECDYIATMDNPYRLYIRVVNSELSDVVTTFNNKEETAELLYGDVLLTGYNKFIAIVLEDTAIKVILTKE